MLNQHPPEKIKYVRGNQIPFMTKQLSKEITKRSRLRNNFLTNRTKGNLGIVSNCEKEIFRVPDIEDIKKGHTQIR